MSTTTRPSFYQNHGIHASQTKKAKDRGRVLLPWVAASCCGASLKQELGLGQRTHFTVTLHWCRYCDKPGNERHAQHVPRHAKGKVWPTASVRALRSHLPVTTAIVKQDTGQPSKPAGMPLIKTGVHSSTSPPASAQTQLGNQETQ
jgi:hypothetical protein